MITFECDLCGKILVYDSLSAMENGGQCSHEYFGPFSLKNNVCNDCYKKLSEKEDDILRESKSNFYKWVEVEFGKKVIGKAVQNNNKGA